MPETDQHSRRTPDLTRVQSSNVEAVGYDRGDRALYVQFNSGDTYVYVNVEPSLYESLLSAPSVGRFLNTNIKARHGYRRL